MAYNYAVFFSTPEKCVRQVYSNQMAAFARLAQLEASHEQPYGGWVEKRKLLYKLTDDAEPVGPIKVELE